MRTYMVGILTVVLVLAGMTWWAFHPQLQQDINEQVEARGYGPVFAQEPETVSWSKTLKPEDYMADTAVEESYNMSCVLHVMNQGDASISANLKSMGARVGGIEDHDFYIYDATSDESWPAGTVPEGETPGEDGFVYHFIYTINGIVDEMNDYFDTSGDWATPDGGCSAYFWVGTSTNWEVEVPFSIVAGDSIIDRTEALNVHMGSDAGPTHSNERYMEDEWDEKSGDSTLVISCGDGEYQAVLRPEDEWTGGEWAGYSPPVPSPGTAITFSSEMHKSPDGETQEGAFESIQCSNIDLSFDGVYEDWDSGDFKTIGNGSDLELWALDHHFAGSYTWSNNFKPPFIVDFSSMGLADWQQTNHNERYDDVWVDGGFVNCSYPGIDFYPGTNPGDSSAVKLGDLHGISPYTQQVAPFSGWTLKADWDYEFMQGATRYLQIVDCDENRALNLPEELIGRYIVFGVPDLTATSCDADPVFSLLPQRSPVDVDLSGNLGKRASGWTGTQTGGAAGTTGAFSADSGDETARTLVDPWKSRCDYYRQEEAWANFPEAYFYHENNTYEGSDGWSDGNHDVYWWSSHRYLDIDCQPDVNVCSPVISPVCQTGLGSCVNVEPIEVSLHYYTETISDNHLTGTDRSVVVSLTGPTIVSYEAEYDSTNGRFRVDLWNEQRPRLQHVRRIEITWPGGQDDEQIEWVCGGLTLVPDESVTDPNNRVTFHEPRHAYVAGGARAVADGKCREVLCTSGNYSTYSGHEYLVEHINWMFGSGTGTDLSGAWSLTQYLSIMGYCCEGWDWSLPENWQNMTVDDNDDSLTGGYSFDLAERQDWDVDDGEYPARFAAYRWDIAKGILYKPHGVVGAQGGIHGLSNLRNGSGGEISRRDSDSGTWLEYDEPGSDGHGYWAEGYDIVSEYDNDDNPVYWQYRVNETPYNTDISRLYPRQWEYAYLELPKWRDPHHWIDPSGRIWLAVARASEGVRIYMRESPQRPWQRYMNALEGHFRDPSGITRNDGAHMVSATRISDGQTVWAVSYDDGCTWEVQA